MSETVTRLESNDVAVTIGRELSAALARRDGGDPADIRLRLIERPDETGQFNVMVFSTLEVVVDTVSPVLMDVLQDREYELELTRFTESVLEEEEQDLPLRLVIGIPEPTVEWYETHVAQTGVPDAPDDDGFAALNIPTPQGEA